MLDQLGSLRISARPRERFLVTRQRQAAGATDHQKDTGAAGPTARVWLVV